MKSYDVTIQMKSYSEQYFPVVVFIVLCKVILTFESVDENLWCGHLNTSYWAGQGTIYCTFFLKNEIQFFFSFVYCNSSLTFQAVAVSYSCNTRNLPFE